AAAGPPSTSATSPFPRARKCASRPSTASRCTSAAEFQRAKSRQRERRTSEFLIVAVIVVVLAIIVISKTAIVVPQQSAYVVQVFGKYGRTLSAGFHILIPFVERVAYRHSLKEMALDIPEQICITKDNVQV